jgi:Gas vesicle synthesis protein GvpL/GvpF
MTASARYLYCVVPARGTPPAVRAAALDGGQVAAIRHRDVAVLTHACAPQPYQGGETEVRGWIAAHNAVIEEAWKSAGTVLPMSFDVIVRGDAGRSAEANVVGWLDEHHAALRARLQALRGLVEVGVQILHGAEAEAGAGAGAGAGDGAGACPRGHAYFARHQLRREQRERLGRTAAAAFGRHGEMLAALASDVQVNRPRPAPGKIMVLNMSLLADSDGVRRIGDYLERVRKEAGTDVRFTGPWPPYSFGDMSGEFGVRAEAASQPTEPDNR